jgi:hypothetical protein
MPSLQEKYLTFEEAKSALDLEEKLFMIKNRNNGKLTVESIPQSFPGFVWYWIDTHTSTLKFIQEKRKKKQEEKIKKKEAKDA